MEIILAKAAGFCFGVKRAIELTHKVLEEERQVFTLGPLIHNPQVVRDLEAKGVKVVNNLNEVPSGVVVLRSHGVSPRLKTKAKEMGLKVVDATCPWVKRVQDLAIRLKMEGYKLIIIGEETHPEVVSILESIEDAIVIESPCSIDSIPQRKRIGLIAQTTQHIESLREIASLLIPKADELRIYNTICRASIRRQENSLRLSKEVDIMIVIGGYNSANTRRLVEICKANVETHHIEEDYEINKDWFIGKERVGVTAGASTPPWIISKVIERLKAL